MWIMDWRRWKTFQYSIETVLFSRMFTYPCCVVEGGWYNQGKYLAMALLSLPFPRVISRAIYCAMPDLTRLPSVSSLRLLQPPFMLFCRDKRRYISQLMTLWYLSHRQPAKAQASLCIRAISPEPSLFAHIEYGSRRRVRPKISHLVPLDGFACVFEERVCGGWKVP